MAHPRWRSLGRGGHAPGLRLAAPQSMTSSDRARARTRRVIPSITTKNGRSPSSAIQSVAPDRLTSAKRRREEDTLATYTWHVTAPADRASCMLFHWRMGKVWGHVLTALFSPPNRRVGGIVVVNTNRIQIFTYTLRALRAPRASQACVHAAATLHRRSIRQPHFVLSPDSKHALRQG